MSVLAKDIIKAIISIFETGSFNNGNQYSAIAVIKGDTGGLSYGKHQVSLNSGNLFMMLNNYVSRKGKSAAKIKPYLDRMRNRDFSLNNERELHLILRNAGSEPLMQSVQDEYFEQIFYIPAREWWARAGFKTNLALLVIYDSFIHGSFNLVRKLIKGDSKDEKVWVQKYVTERFNWLATHKNPLLQKTTYRSKLFLDLIKANNWDLNLPINVRGMNLQNSSFVKGKCVINSKDINDGCEPALAESEENILLILRNPPIREQFVVEFKNALRRYIPEVDNTNVYDEKTVALVKKFQTSKGLKADGIVGLLTRTALDI